MQQLVRYETHSQFSAEKTKDSMWCAVRQWADFGGWFTNLS